jgi:hypothetical protein
MTRVLKSTGPASHGITIWCVDDDNATWKQFVASDTGTVTMLPITCDALTWPSPTPRTLYGGKKTANFAQGPAVVYTAGNPQITTTGTALFLVGNYGGDSALRNFLGVSGFGYGGIVSPHPSFNLLSGNNGIAADANQTGSYYLTAATWDGVTVANSKMWFSLAGGTVAADGGNAVGLQGGFPRSIISLGTNIGDDSRLARYSILHAVFNTVLTQVEMQAIMDDPIGTLFTTGGGGGGIANKTYTGMNSGMADGIDRGMS